MMATVGQFWKRLPIASRLCPKHCDQPDTASAEDAISRPLVDRSSIAKRRRAILNRPQWIAHLITESKALADSLKDHNDQQLRSHTDRLRHYCRGGMPVTQERLLTMAAAAVIQSIRRTLGVSLFDVQIHAGLIVSHGAVAQMQTGEGKTLAGVLPAYLHSLAGRGLHVATTNDYLASRDHGKLSAVFQRLGVTTGLLKPKLSTEETRQAYQTDITYGPGHAFGFDYLRDQLVVQEKQSQPIGQPLLDQLDLTRHTSITRQRSRYCAIIDEIDHVLIDDAVSPLVLSSNSQGEAQDADIHRAACELAANLNETSDFCLATTTPNLSLTNQGYDRVYDDLSMTVHAQLKRPWHEYVLLALQARHSMRRDVHYVVRSDEVQLVDGSTGRIFADRSWSDGLHQAVQAAEKLTITPETQPLAKMTRQRFFRSYEILGGMSGTATECEREFSKVYGLAVHSIPTRLPSKRTVRADVVTANQDKKLQAIAGEAAMLHQSGRPVLIGTLDIAQSDQVAAALASANLPYQLLNGVQDADEAALIGKAGQHGVITVATNMAGRGTDIQLDRRSRELGGLHVIIVERHSLARVDRQLVGRCARCGDPGSATFYLAADDNLPSTIAPWIAKAILRGLSQSQVNDSLVKSHLNRAQQSQQRRATAMRMQLLRQDHGREEAMRRTREPISVSGCWQI